jgi:hypothetical protein
MSLREEFTVTYSKDLLNGQIEGKQDSLHLLIDVMRVEPRRWHIKQGALKRAFMTPETVLDGWRIGHLSHILSQQNGRDKLIAQLSTDEAFNIEFLGFELSKVPPAIGREVFTPSDTGGKVHRDWQP